jgi:inorganic triphosphatase YgiF
MIESEMKFIPESPSVLKEIERLKSIPGWKIEDGGEHCHIDTYYDTPDRLLYKTGIVLRHREKERYSVVSFKARGEPDTEIFRRIEINAPTDITADELMLKGTHLEPFSALYESAGTENLDLSPALKVNNCRHILFLVREGQRGIEVSLDTVEFSGIRGKAVLYEIELESISTTDQELREAGEWLREKFDLKQSGPSKYIYGMDKVG